MTQIGRVAKLVIYNLGLLAAMVLCVEMVSFVAFTVKQATAPGSRLRHTTGIVQRPEQPRDWIDQYFHDEAGMTFPYEIGLWGAEDYRSATINAVDGRRVACGNGSAGRKVFLFGGSTMWGDGVPDRYTIPAIMCRLDQDQHYAFFNFGVPAYVSTQEVLTLSRLLIAGRVPDKVIFYHGVNDIVAAATGKPGHEMFYRRHRRLMAANPGPMIVSLLEKTFTGRIINSIKIRAAGAIARRAPDRALGPEDKAIVERAVRIYLQNLDYTRKLASAYGFQVLHFLQPALLSGYEYEGGRVNRFERGIYEAQNTRIKKMVRLFYDTLRHRGKVKDLSQLFVSLKEKGVYIDSAHLGPDGNEMVAGQLFSVLQ